MPETPVTRLTERVDQAADGRAAAARRGRGGPARARDEASGADGDGRSGTGSAVCAWNHFENIPTFYNWNNRPR